VTALVRDEKFNLVPEGLNRLDRRENYEVNPEHSTLKNKRDKRDEMKERKFKHEQSQYDENAKKSPAEAPGDVS
jgi:lysine 2,3-aminomutase